MAKVKLTDAVVYASETTKNNEVVNGDYETFPVIKNGRMKLKSIEDNKEAWMEINDISKYTEVIEDKPTADLIEQAKEANKINSQVAPVSEDFIDPVANFSLPNPEDYYLIDEQDRKRIKFRDIMISYNEYVREFFGPKYCVKEVTIAEHDALIEKFENLIKVVKDSVDKEKENESVSENK